MASAVPSPVEAAIQQAAGEYGVSPDTLAGIWRIESGSNYPNPYVNSSGYGGLFGVGQAQALEQGYSLYDPSTTLQQARTAASDLAALIKSSGGNVAAALGKYSGGGYTSVPGQGGGTITAPAAVTALAQGVASGQTEAQAAGLPNPVTALGKAGDIASALLKPANWWRLLLYLAGAALIVVGVVIYVFAGGAGANVRRAVAGGAAALA